MSTHRRIAVGTVRQNGAAIKAIRQLRGVTLDALAADLLISRPYLSHLENETKTTPSIELMARLARSLDVPFIAVVCERSDLARAEAA